ncbi:hypothetical protein GQX73_g6709 [Xylaria multiplex]|uniref:Receptor L-domain domain-containing protein n=1 Tax=Xylaria multiplex TaxID=323545 RepID=A0A7C8ILS8_9PEZI|nr:hypothetical protein GQX73_g6709 [Xylaria multiplex]
MPDCLGETFTVANQGDADRLTSSPCGNINIRQAEGTLNFTNVTGSWDTITVSNSPGLQVLRFPQSFSLDLLQISDATSLNELSLPRLIGGNISYTENGAYLFNLNPLDLYITNAPKLLALYINATSFGNLELLGLPSVATDDYVPAGVVTALSIQTDSCLNTARLEAVGSFRIVGVVDCNYQFQNLKSVGNFSLVNAANFRTSLLADVDTLGPLLVNESMVLDNEADKAPYPDLAFDRVSQIGKDLNITSYANVNISFGGLTDIGNSLLISNNTNCTLNFDHVSTATNLILLDNADSVLPLFPELETVENVHFRGYIDTSTGPNIFPVLTLARGTVIVEAWNSEFNCSALESLKNENKIHNLVCNGTNNGTSIPSMSSGGHDSLSPGAKAGIGVGSGIFGLGIVVALTWLILHFRRRLKSVETAVLQGTTVNDDKSEKYAPDVNGIQEVDGTGIIREMPDDHLVELHANVPELPEDHLVELHSGAT